MSPQFPTRPLCILGGVVLVAIVCGLQAANWQRDRMQVGPDEWTNEWRWNRGSGYVDIPASEPLPPGHGVFAIALNGQSEQFQKGQRVDVYYQKGADASSYLIVQDAPIHDMYKPCGQPYPKVELLLVQDDVDRLSSLQEDGGKLTLVRHQPTEATQPAEEAEIVAVEPRLVD